MCGVHAAHKKTKYNKITTCLGIESKPSENVKISSLEGAWISITSDDFARKDRGEGGGKKRYLYIVKIEMFHLVLTSSLIFMHNLFSV